MKKMLLAVVCLGMSANVFAVDLLEAVTAIDALGKSDQALKQIQIYMNAAKTEVNVIKKAANGIFAAQVVYKNITQPLEVIFEGLNSNSIISKFTKGYMGKAAAKLKEINKSLTELGPIAELLSVM